MLTGKLIHPQILAALGRAGHGSTVLVSDGNYPHATAAGRNSEVVYLNLAPGLVNVTDVLKLLCATIPIEKAMVMEPLREGPYAMAGDPPIFTDFRDILAETACAGHLEQVERFDFYKTAGKRNNCLVIATGEQRIYANILLTIGVVKPQA